MKTNIKPTKKEKKMENEKKIYDNDENKEKEIQEKTPFTPESE